MPPGRRARLDSNGPDEAIVSWRGGVRFDAEVRGHLVAVDQPLDEDGTDEGMTPTELMAVSLASCVAYFAARFAHRHGIEIPGLRVGVKWEYAERPHRIGRFDIRVSGGPIDEGLRARLQRVVEGCTVHQTFVLSPEVNVTLALGVD